MEGTAGLQRVPPLQRLPAELISDVFLTCVHQFDMPPECFCHIDRRLRGLSLCTPGLWTTVLNHGLPREEARLMMFLKHSARAPVSMRLCLTRRFLVDGSSHDRLFKAIAPHLARIKSLSITTREEFEILEPPYALEQVGGISLDGVGLLLALFVQYLPALEDLELEIPEYGIPFVTNLVRNALRYIVLATKHITLATNPGDLDIPQLVWGSSPIRTLKLILPTLPTPISLQGLLNSLTALRDLNDLTLELPDTYVTNSVDAAFEVTYRRILPKLERLRLRLQSFAYLAIIHCPVLRFISAQGSRTDEVEGHLKSFLELHRASITSVDVSYVAKTRNRRRDTPRLIPMDLPKLTTFTCFARDERESMLLELIGGSMLRDVSLRVAYHYDTPIKRVIQFLERVSVSVSSIDISVPPSIYLPNYRPRENASQETPVLVFPRLRQFTWDCRLGDAVFAYTKQAPFLSSLRLHGGLDQDFLPSLERRLVEDRDIVLPGLKSMSIEQYSGVMWRIYAPALTSLTIHAVLMNTHATNPEHWETAHRAVYQLLVAHAASLEILTICVPLLPNLFIAPPRAPPIDLPPTHVFPCLRKISLVQSDDTAEWMTAPNLEVLELRDAGPCSAGDGELQPWPLRSLRGFASAQTFRIASLPALNLQGSPMLREFWCLDRVRHLHVDVYTDSCGGEFREPRLLLPELDFLWKLSRTVTCPPTGDPEPEPDAGLGRGPGAKMHGAHRTRWIFPQLETLHIRLVSTNSLHELSTAWLPDAALPGDENTDASLGREPDFSSGAHAAMGEDGACAMELDRPFGHPSEFVDSDEDMYDADSCSDSTAGSARSEGSVFTDDDDGDDEDDDMEDLSDSEYEISRTVAYNLRKRNRALFLRLLHSLKNLARARNTRRLSASTELAGTFDDTERDAQAASAVPSAASITRIIISTDGEFRCSLSIPPVVQDYFDAMSVVLTIETPQD